MEMYVKQITARFIYDWMFIDNGREISNNDLMFWGKEVAAIRNMLRWWLSRVSGSFGSCYVATMTRIMLFLCSSRLMVWLAAY